MYNFIDTIEVSGGVVLPSEALKINGEYIENQISGYRTLTVSGREALSPDVVSYTTGIRDGSRLKSKTYPERIISVQYQLIAKSNDEFRAAYNKLAAILDVEEAELIFNDEQDKFFVGTPCTIGDVTPGTNYVVGKFEILCTDPFKYSVIEYEATPDMDEASVLIDYNGTYKAFPVLEADFYEETDTDGENATPLTGEGDCGYVAFFTENEKIVQIGDPGEVDGETAYEKSQTLVNSAFNKSTSWGTAAQSQWQLNNGVVSDPANISQVGSMGMSVASYETDVIAKETTGTLLNTVSKASAPVIHYELTAKTTNRLSNSVKVRISVKTWLDKSSSYFGRGYSLMGSVYIGGAWRNIKLKDTTEYWKGKSGHTVNLTVTINGLTNSTTSITGIKFKVTRPDGLGQAGLLGETACKNLAISQYADSTPETYYLTPANFGTDTKWHGASITRTLPADAKGETGAANFTLSYSQKMAISAANQLGAFQVQIVSGTSIVAGVNIYKGSNGTKAKLRFYVNNTVAETMEVDLSANNKYFNSSKSSTVTKSGETVTFNICGIKKTFRDDDISDTAVDKVTFTITRYGTKPGLKYNGLYWAKFVKNNCDTWKDIPNKFSAGDVVEADCKNGEIYLNGVLTPSLGALGNDWEEFILTPGLNQIGVSYSEWVADEYAPKFKVRYREVFL